MKKDFLEVNGARHPVLIHFEQREDVRASIGKSAVHIRVPHSMQREELFLRILGMKAWARKKLMENPESFKKEGAKEYHDGDTLQVGEDAYTLKIEFRDKESSSARIAGNCIHLIISSNLSDDRKKKHISTLLSRCVARRRLPELHERIKRHNSLHFSQPLKKIFFKNNSSNWGSCSRQGNINISTRLLFTPDDMLDYVCIHELAHLIEHNHSDRFWALVEKAMPDYKEKEKWLKEHGSTCVF